MTFIPQNFRTQNTPAVSAAWLNGIDITVNGALQGVQTTPELVQLLGGIILKASSPALVVSANSSGVVSDFSAANGQVNLFQGNTDVTASAVLSIATTNCSATVNTALNTPLEGPLGFYQFSALTATTGTAVISALYNGYTYTTQVNITKVLAGSPGTGGVLLVLSNPVATVLAYANGAVPSFAGISGQARVLSGGTDVSSSATWSATTSGLSGTVNTAANTPVTGEPIGYYQVTGMTETVASLIISAVYEGNTLTSTFTVTQVPTGYEIVSTLPTTNLFQGRVVFLTTDNQLYRYDGGEWTAAVQATDVTGQLTAAQIASINAAQLTGQITTTQIANNSITTPLLAAGAVTTAALAAGSVTASTIAASSITATQLAANSVTATQIAAGSVTTNAIQAGAVTAAEIGVSSLSAISANIGAVTAGTLSNSSGSSLVDLNNAWIVFNNGAYMIVRGLNFGAASNYLEWYGPTQSSAGNFAACTDALALYYLKNNGQLYFGGTTIAVPPSVNVYTGTGAPTTQIITVPSGRTLMTVELWGNGGGGTASSNPGTVMGAGGGSGSYCRSVYSCSGQAGNTLTATLWEGSVGGESSTVVAGTFTGFTTMTANAGASASGSGIGIPGSGGTIATGGNQVNVVGSQGLSGSTDGSLSGGAGGHPIVGIYGSGGAGAHASASSSPSAGTPSVCIATFQ